MRALDLQISVNGWVVLTVGEGEEAFTYTVGLVEHYDHPELIVVDLAREHQYELINTLAKGVAARGRPALDLPSMRGVRCVEVHADHLQGDYFGTWSNRYGRLLQPGEALQVVPPPTWFCACHANAMRRLDLPAGSPRFRPAPNRAQRRRRGR